MLFEVNAVDPAVIVLAAAALLLLTLAASFGPARRAASIEPVEALRAE
jgi:ABC-type lipoprotein release transport system permease subunit